MVLNPRDQFGGIFFKIFLAVKNTSMDIANCRGWGIDVLILQVRAEARQPAQHVMS